MKVIVERSCDCSTGRMIESANQKQQNSHSFKHVPLSQVTAQIDIPSTLFAVNVLAMSMTNQKYNKPLLPKKFQKALRHVNKAKALELKVGERIGDAIWYR